MKKVHDSRISSSELEARRRIRPARSDPDYGILKYLHRDLRRVLGELPGPMGMAVDSGCGTRPYDSILRSVAQAVVGVDLSGNDRADMTHEPGQPMPLADGSADLVGSFQVLEHIAEPQAYLRELRRILRPQGYLVLSTHGVWPYHPHPADYRRWTHDGLRLECERAGFTVRELIPVLPGWAAALQLGLCLLHYTGWRRRRYRWPVRAIAWLASWAVDLLERFRGPAGDLAACVYVVKATKNEESANGRKDPDECS